MATVKPRGRWGSKFNGLSNSPHTNRSPDLQSKCQAAQHHATSFAPKNGGKKMKATFCGLSCLFLFLFFLRFTDLQQKLDVITVGGSHEEIISMHVKLDSYIKFNSVFLVSLCRVSLNSSLRRSVRPVRLSAFCSVKMACENVKWHGSLFRCLKVYPASWFFLFHFHKFMM